MSKITIKQLRKDIKKAKCTLAKYKKKISDCDEKIKPLKLRIKEQNRDLGILEKDIDIINTLGKGMVADLKKARGIE